MTSNLCPGRSQNTNHCRHCGSDIEILAHILGACPHGDMLRNARHHKVRSMIAQVFRETRFHDYEGVHGVSETGSHRRDDIIAVQTDSSSAIIIDPMIRWEINNDQPISVHKEKCSIHEPTIQYYPTKYHLTSIEVVGLMIGARVLCPISLLNSASVSKSITLVALCAVKGSLLILINHLCDVQNVTC